MKAIVFLILIAAGFFTAPAQLSAQYYRQQQQGPATTRHCQTDYDHRAHYYHSGTHYHYCPGGAHYHSGGYVSRGVSRAAAYDPVVADIQSKLVSLGLYHHKHHNQIDGIFGNETRHAVEDFQRSRQLPATGQLDAQTLAAFGVAAPGYGAAAPLQGGQVPSPVQPAPPLGNGPAIGAATAASPVAPVGNGTGILTPEETAQVMRVSEKEVLELLESGELKGRRIGDSWRVTADAIDSFLKGDNVASPKEPQKAEPDEEEVPSKGGHNHSHEGHSHEKPSPSNKKE